jgi:hypothetical protein
MANAAPDPALLSPLPMPDAVAFAVMMPWRVADLAERARRQTAKKDKYRAYEKKLSHYLCLPVFSVFRD